MLKSLDKLSNIGEWMIAITDPLDFKQDELTSSQTFGPSLQSSKIMDISLRVDSVSSEDDAKSDDEIKSHNSKERETVSKNGNFCNSQQNMNSIAISNNDLKLPLNDLNHRTDSYVEEISNQNLQENIRKCLNSGKKQEEKLSSRTEEKTNSSQIEAKVNSSTDVRNLSTSRDFSSEQRHMTEHRDSLDNRIIEDKSADTAVRLIEKYLPTTKLRSTLSKSYDFRQKSTESPRLLPLRHSMDRPKPQVPPRKSLLLSSQSHPTKSLDSKDSRLIQKENNSEGFGSHSTIKDCLDCTESSPIPEKDEKSNIIKQVDDSVISGDVRMKTKEDNNDLTVFHEQTTKPEVSPKTNTINSNKSENQNKRDSEAEDEVLSEDSLSFAIDNRQISVTHLLDNRQLSVIHSTGQNEDLVEPQDKMSRSMQDRKLRQTQDRHSRHTQDRLSRHTQDRLSRHTKDRESRHTQDRHSINRQSITYSKHHLVQKTNSSVNYAKDMTVTKDINLARRSFFLNDDPIENRPFVIKSHEDFEETNEKAFRDEVDMNALVSGVSTDVDYQISSSENHKNCESKNKVKLKLKSNSLDTKNCNESKTMTERLNIDTFSHHPNFVPEINEDLKLDIRSSSDFCIRDSLDSDSDSGEPLIYNFNNTGKYSEDKSEKEDNHSRKSTEKCTKTPEATKCSSLLDKTAFQRPQFSAADIAHQKTKLSKPKKDFRELRRKKSVPPIQRDLRFSLRASMLVAQKEQLKHVTTQKGELPSEETGSERPTPSVASILKKVSLRFSILILQARIQLINCKCLLLS